eukprot:1324502-Rhodomonas_salina.2
MEVSHRSALRIALFCSTVAILAWAFVLNFSERGRTQLLSTGGKTGGQHGTFRCVVKAGKADCSGLGVNELAKKPEIKKVFQSFSPSDCAHSPARKFPWYSRYASESINGKSRKRIDCFH